MQRVEEGKSAPETGVVRSSDTKTKGRKVATSEMGDGEESQRPVRSEISSWLASSVDVTLHRSAKRNFSRVPSSRKSSGNRKRGRRTIHAPKKKQNCVFGFEKKKRKKKNHGPYRARDRKEITCLFDHASLLSR